MKRHRLGETPIQTSSLRIAVSIGLYALSVAASAASAALPLDTPEFSVQLPENAKRNTTVQQTPYGAVESTTWQFARGTVEIAFSYADTPIESNDPDRTLGAVRDGALKGTRATLTREERISISEGPGGPTWPGRQIEATLPGGSFAMRLLLVRKRVYQLMVTHPRGTRRPAEYDRMVASFRLKPAPAASTLVDTAEFSVRLPLGSTRTEKTVETDIGSVTIVYWERNLSGTILGFSHADYPRPPDSPAASLDGARDHGLASVHGKLTAEDRVTLADGASGTAWPGRIVHASVPAGKLELRIYLVGNRLYQLMIMQPPGAPRPAAYDQMLSSFEVKASTESVASPDTADPDAGASDEP